jgi:two-component system CheB/CheR fusion protein
MKKSPAAPPTEPDLKESKAADSAATKPGPQADGQASPASDVGARGGPGEFFIVGIGASAGGLEPISEILRRLSGAANLAVVIVQHLDPHHESILADLLTRVTSLPVEWASKGRSVEPGHVYVSPPKTCLAIERGVLVLREPGASKTGGEVNHFFQSLAGDAGHRAVGVILSGNGSDGTFGAKAIKDFGGLVFAQEPATAGFPSMPQSAIEAKCVDRVLTPVGIAEELLKLTQHAPVLWSRIAAPDDGPPAGTEADHLHAIFRVLAVRMGVDFSDYKLSTIKRRLVRQMMLAKVTDLGEYVKLLQKNREEAERLYESLLINVTEFFRDSEYFDCLREQVLPSLLAHHPDTPIRIWVPGCSTGEEAYSLGMLVRELLDDKGLARPVQIFGTDVSDWAIAYARAGVYSGNDVASVAPERLHRFFYQTERGYAIQKPIRDMCVFARQNVAKDSPFSRIDLISCRNLLIYLSQKLQRKLMPIFHYALNPGGYLVLGNSESVGGHADLFRIVDRRFRIYSKKATSRRPHFEFTVGPVEPVAEPAPKPIPAMTEDMKEPFDVIREADRIVLHRHGPVGVLVNEDLEILQFRGDVSPYLALSAGRASLNLINLAREGLAGELQTAMNEARNKRARAQRTGVNMMQGDTARAIDVDITPIDTVQGKEQFYLVLFAPTGPAKSSAAGKEQSKPRPKPSAQEVQIGQLRQDLQATRNYLQSTIEKHEGTNQELRAANEEIQSSNEELQSTNEELETAKEELQSTNEELTTVNEELHSRQLELIQVNNDLTNLINSVHLPIIILGQDMRIRRFTPMAEKVLNLIPTDIGRPLTDININLAINNLPRLIAEVVDSLTIREMEVQDRHGRWYSLRLRPYKTADNKIDGVVLTLIDIEEMKRIAGAMEEARDFAEAVIHSARDPMAVLTSDLRIKSANDALARALHMTREAILERSFFDAIRDPRAMKNLRSALEGVLPTRNSLTDYEVSMELPAVGVRRFLIDARAIKSQTRTYAMILLSLRVRT